MYPVKKEAFGRINWNRNANIKVKSCSLFHWGKHCDVLPNKYMFTETWEHFLLLQKYVGMHLHKPSHSSLSANTNIRENNSYAKRKW